MPRNPPADQPTSAVMVGAAEVLRTLGCDDEELAALRRQGTVHEELHRGATIFKLRFRCGGVQRVKYLGSDRGHADDVVRALALLQYARRSAAELRRLIRSAKRQLRSVKQELSPAAFAAGWHWHGLSLRRRGRGKKHRS